MPTPLSKTVFKAFAMLGSFRSDDEWLTSKELSLRANLPQASGYRLVKTLEEIGAIVRGPRGRYRPGMLLVSLSQNVVVSELLHEASQAIADDLAALMNVTVHVGMFEDGMVTYVTKASSPGSFATHTRAGSQLEAYCSALGKVLMADMPIGHLEDTVLARELIALTPYTITDHAVLRRQLADVRRQGYAIDDREARADMCCVAVPIRDGEGRTVAALSATDSAENMTSERQAKLRRALTEASALLNRKVYLTADSRRDPLAGRPDRLGLPVRDGQNNELRRLS